MVSLDKLPINKSAKIVKILPSKLKTRLYVLGVFVGVTVKIVYVAPLKDPFVLDVLGYKLAVRKDILSKILVEPL